MNNIFIVGGGFSGWITALFLQRSFPHFDIKVIQSSKIEILGVGESTTPMIIELFDYLGISIQDLITNCGATIKNATKFTNWNNDGKSYFHGFRIYDSQLDIYFKTKFSPYSKYFFNNGTESCRSFVAINEIYNKRNLDGIYLPSILSHRNKIPLSINAGKKFVHTNPLAHFDHHCSFALHLDASKVAVYLRQIGIERGIESIDGLVSSVKQDKDDYVEELILDDKRKYKCNFVFDCTGFSRLFVDKIFKSKFKSYRDYLPMKKAIPFQIENKGKTPPYTEAISMKYGWMWKTSASGRFGCGYTFDSDYISEDQAYDEVSKVIKQKPNIKKVISFSPGYFKTPWNKNVLSIGLSSGFIEPLEASSIWLTTMCLRIFLQNIGGFLNREQKIIDEYNKEFQKRTEGILNLVYFHYLCKRSDTLFWKEFRKKNKIPEQLEQILEIYSYRIPIGTDFCFNRTFNETSWILVGAGNNFFDMDIINKEYDLFNIKQNLGNSIEKFKSSLSLVEHNCIDHDDFIDYIKHK